jgi:Zn-dependent peptidase ImmA (M78 family)
MIHLLEANGIRVFSLAVEAKEVDAFSMWHGSTPVVMLNSFKSSEHSRFDAAHELAHLVLHKHAGASANKQAEFQADAFASAFLMPRASVLAQAPKFCSVDALVRLKEVWGVSVSALNYRLHKVGVTSDWQYRALCVELSKRGYRSKEPNECPRESSIILPKLLSSLYQEDGLTRGAIANAMNLPLSELNDLLFGLTISSIDGSRTGPLPTGTRAGLLLIK